MNCPKCQTEISVAHKYCHKCGENLIEQCSCGEKDYNKTANLCEKKIIQAQEEDTKITGKIVKLQAIFANVAAMIVLGSCVVNLLFSDFLFPIAVCAGGIFLVIVYVIIRKRKGKIIKNFSTSHPEYYAAKYKE